MKISKICYVSTVLQDEWISTHQNNVNNKIKNLSELYDIINISHFTIYYNTVPKAFVAKLTCVYKKRNRRVNS